MLKPVNVKSWVIASNSVFLCHSLFCEDLLLAFIVKFHPNRVVDCLEAQCRAKGNILPCTVLERMQMNQSSECLFLIFVCP